MGRAERGRKLLEGEQGYVFVAALVLTLVLLMVGSGLAMLASAALGAFRFELDRLRAVYLAESGLSHALELLRTGQATLSSLSATDPSSRPWFSLGQEQQYRFWVDTENPVCASFRLLADGRSFQRQRRLRVLLGGAVVFPKVVVDLSTPECAGYQPPAVSTPDPSSWPCPGAGCVVRPPADQATFTGPGSYLVNSNWTVGHDGRITLNGIVPPGQALNLVVRGDLALMQDAVIEFLASGPVNVYVLGNLLVKQNSRVVSTPQAQVRWYVWGNVEVWQRSRWEFAVQDWVIFTIRGGLELKQDASIAKAAGYTQRAVVFLMDTSGSQGVTLSQDFALQEGLYAPTRPVTLQTNSNPDTEQLFGSIVAGQLSCQGSGGCGELTYDPALRDFLLGELGPVPGSWREERTS